MRIIQNIKSNPFEWIFVFVLFVFFFPILFIPDTARYLTHDNLDSNVVWYKCLAESGLMFKQGTLDFILGGIPRDCFPSEWSIDKLLYLVFSPQTAYGINYILLHCIAFIGMRLFLRRYVTLNKAIFNLVALSFAMLPFWVSGGITVATNRQWLGNKQRFESDNKSIVEVEQLFSKIEHNRKGLILYVGSDYESMLSRFYTTPNPSFQTELFEDGFVIYYKKQID